MIFQPSHFDDTIALLCAQCVCAHIHFFFHHLQILVRKNKKRSTICEIHWLIFIICDTRLSLWHFFADWPENHKFHCSFIDIDISCMVVFHYLFFRNFHFLYILAKVVGKFLFDYSLGLTKYLALLWKSFYIFPIICWSEYNFRFLIVLVILLIHICIFFLWLSKRRDESRWPRFLGKLKNLET